MVVKEGGHRKRKNDYLGNDQVHSSSLWTIVPTPPVHCDQAGWIKNVFKHSFSNESRRNSRTFTVVVRFMTVT